MVAKKVKYQLARFRDYLEKKLGSINGGMIFGGVFYVILVSVLLVNAYTAYNRGIENLKRYDEEKEITDKLVRENKELEDLYRYYSSIDFKKMYARDNLNLAERNETLYQIERNEPLDVETIKSETPKKEVSNISLWSKLLFGL